MGVGTVGTIVGFSVDVSFGMDTGAAVGPPSGRKALNVQDKSIMVQSEMAYIFFMAESFYLQGDSESELV